MRAERVVGSCSGNDRDNLCGLQMTAIVDLFLRFAALSIIRCCRLCFRPSMTVSSSRDCSDVDHAGCRAVSLQLSLHSASSHTHNRACSTFMPSEAARDADVAPTVTTDGDTAQPTASLMTSHSSAVLPSPVNHSPTVLPADSQSSSAMSSTSTTTNGAPALLDTATTNTTAAASVNSPPVPPSMSPSAELPPPHPRPSTLSTIHSPSDTPSSSLPSSQIHSLSSSPTNSSHSYPSPSSQPSPSFVVCHVVHLHPAAQVVINCIHVRQCAAHPRSQAIPLPAPASSVRKEKSSML